MDRTSGVLGHQGSKRAHPAANRPHVAPGGNACPASNQPVGSHRWHPALALASDACLESAQASTCPNAGDCGWHEHVHGPLYCWLVVGSKVCEPSPRGGPGGSPSFPAGLPATRLCDRAFSGEQSASSCLGIYHVRQFQAPRPWRRPFSVVEASVLAPLSRGMSVMAIYYVRIVGRYALRHDTANLSRLYGEARDPSKVRNSPQGRNSPRIPGPGGRPARGYVTYTVHEMPSQSSTTREPTASIAGRIGCRVGNPASWLH